MSANELERGTPVRFTALLGLLETINAAGFSDTVVQAGDTGTYWGRHPFPSMAGWHVIAVEREGRTLYCPCLPHHFERIEQ